MENKILKDAREFLIKYLRGKKCLYENLHPWRDDWRFVIHHSFRVEEYAVEIIKREKRDYSKEEVLLIRLACILHDIGRMNRREGHAELSVKIVQDWFKTNPSLIKEIGDIEKLYYLILEHSDKTGPAYDPLLGVVKDADILDEIGIMSIFMAANHVNRCSANFFKDLLERVKSYEIEFCDRKMKILSTTPAKKILQEKKDFIQNFIKQLESELKGMGKISNFLEEI